MLTRQKDKYYHILVVDYELFCAGNDVTRFESQQLDECNNNVPDNVVVLPSNPHSKTSSNSSSPSPSLRSSPSSSLLSPSSTSTTSSSSDAVCFTQKTIHSVAKFIFIFKIYSDIDFFLLCVSQDSDGTPCKTAKQQSGRGSSSHREKSSAVNHRPQSHTTSTVTGSNKGGKVHRSF